MSYQQCLAAVRPLSLVEAQALAKRDAFHFLSAPPSSKLVCAFGAATLHRTVFVFESLYSVRLS